MSGPGVQRRHPLLALLWIALSLVAWLVDRTANQARRLSAEVLLLTGMLPVCSRCRKIRQSQGDWQPLDTYVAQNPGGFQHELCPDCAQMSADVFDRR